MSERNNAALKMFTPLDGIVIALIAAAAVLAMVLPPLLRPQANCTAVITCGGEAVEEIALDSVKEPYSLELPTEPKTVVTVEPGRICFSLSGCPDQLCVRTGWLERAGDTAACLPANAVITLVSSRMGADDILTY